MFGSLNKVELIGSLGADPEIKSFQSGGRVCNLRLATSESWKDKATGERKERTEWHSVTVWPDGLVGLCERFLRKGSKVYVEGKLETRKWTDSGGNDRYSTEVVIRPYGGQIIKLDKSERGAGAASSDRAGGYGGTNDTASDWGRTGGTGGGFGDDLDDDIPF